MSYQSGTPFLNLPQTVGSDHRDWFDTNEAFLNLDTKMKTLWDGSSSTETILTALQESVASLATDVSTLSGIVSGHTSTITTINESLVLINTALNALNTQVVGKFDSVGIADAYDASYGVYAVGDVVTYNGQRYVCTTAVTAAEPFDVSKWNAEDVQTVLDNLQIQEVKYVDVTVTGTVPVAGGGGLDVTIPGLTSDNDCINAVIHGYDAPGAGGLIVKPLLKENNTWSIFIGSVYSTTLSFNGNVRVYYI